MFSPMKSFTESEIVALLRQHEINPTAQRVEITRVLLSACAHLSAEDVFRRVNTDSQHVSKATVYNTLGVLAESGVIREVIADPDRVFYDPNTAPHHHFYNVETGELTDIDASEVQLTGLPPLPEGASVQGVDVIVRLRQTK
jgi:Fur family transcriptional regulator, iron response regulator